jgi:uncharacterized protein (DUF433 family)
MPTPTGQWGQGADGDRHPTRESEVQRVVFVGLVDGRTPDAYSIAMNVVLVTLPDGIVSIDVKRLGGEPVFAGTRVPVKTLLDYIEAGDSLDLFLYDFPTVSRQQAVAVLEWAKNSLTALTA